MLERENPHQLDKLDETRKSFYCDILNNHNVENSYLRRLFLKNCPPVDPNMPSSALEMVAKLAHFQNLEQPDAVDNDSNGTNYEDAIKLITSFRDLNRFIYLQEELFKFKNIHNPDTSILDRIPTIEREMKEIKARWRILSLNANYPVDVIESANKFLIAESDNYPYKGMATQDFVDALRAHDFITFSRLCDFVLRKYANAFEMGADDLGELLPHELAKTDFGLEDLRLLNFYIEMFSSIGGRDSDAELRNHLIHFQVFIPVMVASKTVSQDAYYPRRDIRNSNEYRELIRLNAAAYTSHKANIDHCCKLQSNYVYSKDEDGKDIITSTERNDNSSVKSTQFNDDVAAFEKEHKQKFYRSIIIHLLRTVKIQQVDQDISKYIDKAFQVEFKQELLQFQINNADLVQKWQLQLLKPASESNILAELEEILTSAADANQANSNVEHRINDIIYILRRWRLHIDDRIEVELIKLMCLELNDLANVADVKTHLFVANKIIKSIGDNDKIFERIKSDFEKYPPAAEDVIEYNRSILNVEKTKALVLKVYAALQSGDQYRILIALERFSVHIENTLGVEYGHGIRQHTDRELRDTNINDYATLLLNAIGEEDGINNLSIPNEKIFRAMSEAIFDIMTATDMDQAPHYKQLYPLLLKLKNGSQFFEKLLRGRGEQEIIDQEFEDARDKCVKKVVPQLLIEHLLKTIPLKDISSKIDSSFTDNDQKVAFKKLFTDYMISHAYEIHQWQTDLVVGARADQLFHERVSVLPENYAQFVAMKVKAGKEVPTEAQFDASKKANISALIKESSEKANELREKVSKDVCEAFIKNIKKNIEDLGSQWRVALGGEEIHIPGMQDPIKVAKHIAEIYKHCVKATQDPHPNWDKYFNDIAAIGRKASEPHRFDFFGMRKRDALTQSFYDKINASFINRDRFRGHRTR